MLPEDDRTQSEILGRSPDWIDQHPDPRRQTEKSVASMPATMSFVLALLAFCGMQVFSIIIGNWRWSISGLVVLLVGLLIGTCLQNYANRRAR